MIKDEKGKNVGKWIHYFEQIDQYRIESPPVITGGLKMEKIKSISNVHR